MPILEPRANLLEIETRWELLPPPPNPEHPSYEARWTYLFETYTPAMSRYTNALLRRLMGPRATKEMAEEVLQDYLAKCLERDWLGRNAADIRSFRRYLRAQLFRFVHDYVDHARAARRDPGAVVSMDELRSLRADVADPAEQEFNAGFVDAAMQAAIARLAQRSEDQAEVVRDLMRTGGAGSPDLADRLQQSAASLRVLRHRARRSISTLFVEELRRVVRDADALESLLSTLDPHLP